MENYGYGSNMIITDDCQYKELVERMNRDECILTPIFRDPYYHPAENTILCVSVTFTNTDTYLVSISHTDAPTFTVPTGSKVYTDTDINILAYINGVPVPKQEYGVYITSTQQQFQMFRDTNKLIPITIWGKHLREYNLQLLSILQQYKDTVDSFAYTFTKTLSETLKVIESSSIRIHKERFFEHFDRKTERYFKTDNVYSQYNIFTTTGRPSNRFGGINFSALNKSDGSRDAFVSRYTDGVLVQFDFEAYHLRLVADEHRIALPTGSLHMELAKKYFNTDTITDELYAASKQKTFEIMYGMSDETYGVELFESIVHIRRLFKEVTGPFVLPSGVIVNFTEPNISKMFNYHVQSLEIVKTLPKLQKVLEVLKNTTNHLVLYTYDSILLDMQTFDKNIIQEVMEILEENKKFPVRIHAGNTYNNITEIRL
jgi:hypothetical protein